MIYVALAGRWQERRSQRSTRPSPSVEHRDSPRTRSSPTLTLTAKLQASASRRQQCQRGRHAASAGHQAKSSNRRRIDAGTAEERVRKQLDEKLDDGKKARLKVNGTLTDTSDATDGAKLKVKLTG